MPAAPRPVLPPPLWTALYGLAVIGGLLVPTASAQANPPMPAQTKPDTTQADTTVQSADETTAPSPPMVDDDESPGETALETLIEILILGPLLLILLSLLLAVPTVLLAVSLVMDGGCFRYILFGMGWLCALIYGMIVGVIVGEGILGLEVLVKPLFYVFLWGYPMVAYWGHKKLQAMPDEQYRAWDQTLTGGALLGFGAGSVAGLLRSIGSGFGGFGGGSFGGGGASGSWSGASGVSGSSASLGSASSTAASTSASAAGGSSPAAVAAGAAPGVAAENPSDTPDPESESRGLWTRVRHWFQKFQWYHGLAFILVSLVFVPLGLGTMKALQNTKFFVFALVSVVLYSGYKLFRRNPNAPQDVFRFVSSFMGGKASSSWS